MEDYESDGEDSAERKVRPLRLADILGGDEDNEEHTLGRLEEDEYHQRKVWILTSTEVILMPMSSPLFCAL